MNRSEILQIAKPILFNTDEVRATLENRKTVKRRGIKPQPTHEGGFWKLGGAGWSDDIRVIHPVPCHSLYNRMPYRPEDYLYVRETWCVLPVNEAGHMRGHDIYYYRADGDLRPTGWKGRWHPSIHMPKEAARIFLRVTDVRVERLSDITITGLQNEGILPNCYVSQYAACTTDSFEIFKKLWNTTCKKGLDKYGWDASPWVWVIEFERVEVEA